MFALLQSDAKAQRAKEIVRREGPEDAA